MNKYCILIANASNARIFTSSKVGGEMTLIQELSHPESRQKESDLVSGRPGNHASQLGSGTYAERSNHKDIEATNFAKEISERLNHIKGNGGFDRLVLVAPARFMGLLNQSCDSYLAALINLKIQKDYTHHAERDLPSILEKEKL